MSNHPARKVLAVLSVIATGLVLVITLGLASTQTLFAQRVAQQPQQGERLKTLTLSGKGGTRRSATPKAGSRPRPLTRAERLSLFKGRVVISSFTLTPEKPGFSNIGRIYFEAPAYVFPSPDPGSFDLPQGNRVKFNAGPPSTLHVPLNLKAGQLYALDFSVWARNDGTFTVKNINDDIQQTNEVNAGGHHITAYVTPQFGGWMYFWLTCDSEWEFYSVEVTEL